MQSKMTQLGRLLLLLAIYVCTYMTYRVVMHKQQLLHGSWTQLGSLFAGAFISGIVFMAFWQFWFIKRQKLVPTGAPDHTELSSK